MCSDKPSSTVTTNHPSACKQIQPKTRGVVEEQTRDRVRRKLHDDLDDLRRDLVKTFEHAQKRRRDGHRKKRDRDADHQAQRT